MPVFGIVAEGKTDQRVIENVLEGLCDVEDTRYVQPPALGDGNESFGNWGHVVRFLRSGEYLEALSLVDYLVVHIDTDVLELFRDQTDDLAVATDDALEETVARLSALLAAPEDRGRIAFAVGVESIECWLLGLLLDGANGEERKARTKTNNCMSIANKKLKKLGRLGLGKLPMRYADESYPFRKKAKVDACAKLNPGLARFVEELKTLGLVTKR